MKKIIIVREPGPGMYIIDHIGLFWGKMGLLVENCTDPNKLQDADIYMLHVDKTRIPKDYLASLKDKAVVINGASANMSRKLFSKLLVKQDSSYQGPCIVKTASNYGNKPEYRASLTSHKTLLRRFRRILSREKDKEHITDYNDWATTEYIHPLKYPVYESLCEIPVGVWKNPNLIVERFLPEQNNGLNYVRYWSFLGDADFTGRLGSRENIVKFGNASSFEEDIPIPSGLKQLRKKLGLNYGRFDFVMHENSPYVIDVNRTPGASVSLSGWEHQIQQLARGITLYL